MTAVAEPANACCATIGRTRTEHARRVHTIGTAAPLPRAHRDKLYLTCTAEMGKPAGASAKTATRQRTPSCIITTRTCTPVGARGRVRAGVHESGGQTRLLLTHAKEGLCTPSKLGAGVLSPVHARLLLCAKRSRRPSPMYRRSPVAHVRLPPPIVRPTRTRRRSEDAGTAQRKQAGGRVLGRKGISMQRRKCKPLRAPVRHCVWTHHRQAWH
jgi:hypothetical protein